MSSSFHSVFVLVSCNYSGSGRLCIRTSDMASLSDIKVYIIYIYVFFYLLIILSSFQVCSMGLQHSVIFCISNCNLGKSPNFTAFLTYSSQIKNS